MIRTTRTLALVALFAAATVAGCSKDEGSAKGGESPESAGASRVSPKTAGTPEEKGPAVKMIDQGAEPRQELRFKVNKGDQQKVEMSMDMSMKIDMQGMAMPEQRIPTTKMLMEVSVTDVMDNGDTRWEMTVLSADVVDDPTINPMVVSAMKDGLKGITDFKGWAVITNRGFVKEADITIPPTADPQMRQMMEGTRQSLDQLTAPLPAEPVGVGAKWEVSQDISQQGMTIQQTAKYTVTAIEGNLIKADVELTQRADQQKVDMPGMPPGVSAELLQFDTKGGGNTQIDLTKVVPPAGTVSADMSMRTKIDAQGQSQTMAMSMKMKIDIKGM